MGSDGPPPPERARTAVWSAPTLFVHAPGADAIEVLSFGVDRTGGPVPLLAAANPLAQHLAAAPHSLPVLVEAVAMCPLPLSDRVRTRVWLTGWLDPVPPSGEAEYAHLVATREQDAELLFRGTDRMLARVTVREVRLAGADGGRQAEVDPLADVEAAHLGHLICAHRDVLAELCTLLSPLLVRSARRLLPVQLDRYGLVLRAEHAGGASDIRLPFTPPLAAAGQLGGAVLRLRAEAERAAQRCACVSDRRPPPRRT
jgi:hypothetical protein